VRGVRPGSPVFMIRFFILRFVVPLIILLFARAVLRTLATGFLHKPRRAGPQPQVPPRDVPATAELKKDPVCGTYVSATTSLTRTVNGKILHFCSEECRNKYRAA
jgi:YHS domain-containing protein